MAANCAVCASGCPFSALQAAVDAAASGATIRICAGTLRRSQAIAEIDKDLTIVGAGDGADEATNTILDADGIGQVLRIQKARAVTLQGLRLTGGVSGGAIRLRLSQTRGCTERRFQLADQAGDMSWPLTAAAAATSYASHWISPPLNAGDG